MRSKVDQRPAPRHTEARLHSRTRTAFSSALTSSQALFPVQPEMCDGIVMVRRPSVRLCCKNPRDAQRAGGRANRCGRGESHAEPDGESARSGQSGERESEPDSREEEVRTRRAKRARGSARTSRLVRAEGGHRLSGWSQAVAKPREAAKAAGTPNTRIVTGPAVEPRALRASRSCQQRRDRARCARDRITSAGGGEAAAGGDRLISRRWWRTSRMQARRCVLRLQSRQRSGAGLTWSGCNSTLTWRGLAVAPPFH